MKVKNYEKYSFIYLIIILLFFIEILGIIILLTFKIYSYKKMSGIVISENRIVLMLNKEDKKILYKNQNAYIDNYCRRYKIIENRGKLFSKGKEDYYEIIVDVKFSDKYKPNDLVELSLNDEKYKIIKIFKIIWEGD
jgi:hypothetical protein